MSKRVKIERNKDYEKNQINDIFNILHCVIKEGIYTRVKNFDIEYALTKEPVPFDKKDSLSYQKIEEGKAWGKELFDCAWFHLTCDLKDIKDREDLFIAFDINGEALLYSNDGNPLKGFTNGSSCFDRGLGNPGKEYYPLKGLINKDGKVSLWFDAGYNDLFGNIQEDGKIKFAYVGRKNYENEDIFNDANVLLTLLQSIDNTSIFYKPLLKGLIEVRDLYWYDSKDKYVKAKAITKELLSIKSNSEFKAICVGHAHLDLAWLWPLRESHRKALRTFTNVLYLFKKNPKFHFVVSQPQQLLWVKNESPYIFNQLVKYEKEGRLELVGGSFIEMDTNLISEEEMARQMLYGQKFLKENFGHYTDILWLPDTFGYSGAIPQVMKLGGQDKFVTTKISWNTVNKFPYHNFYWEGIDGSKVLTHLPPEGTYNSGASPLSLINMEKNIAPIDAIKTGLIVYGIGDGGGGPGDEHVNNIDREESLMCLPHAEYGTAEDLFDELEKASSLLKTHKGELYLENHQGTYTSQSEMKRYNRLLSYKIKTIEWYLKNIDNTTYDDELKDLYQRVLLLEFHDILPGSAIQRVYKEAQKEYEDIDNQLDEIMSSSLEGYSKEYAHGDYVINSLTYNVHKVFKEGNSYYSMELPSQSFSSDYLENKYEGEIKDSNIDTKNFTIAFNKEDGYIQSIFDKRANKEVLNGHGDKLLVYRDHGDAWNIMDSYRNQEPALMKLDKRVISKYGKIIEVKSTYSFKESQVEETMIIDDDSPRIDFLMDIDWKNLGYMLRTDFDIAVKSKEATCDIQFGTIKRKRTENDSVEKAQFEVCAQNFIDVSEKKYGVSLINNAKDGYYIKGTHLELALLRSTNHPCVNGDIGHTSCSYSLFMHNCPYSDSKADKEAYIFNSVFLVSSKMPHFSPCFLYVNEDVEYSCFKSPYSGKEGAILRLYERSGKRTDMRLEYDHNRFNKLTEVNILEDKVKDLDSDSIEFGPFQIKTLWLHQL